jgi:hypothetical protein
MGVRARIVKWMMVAIVVCLVGQASAQPAASRSAFDSLSPDKMNETFRKMGMLEVQERYIHQQEQAGADASKLKRLLGDLKLSQADRAASDTEKYALIDDALAAYLEVIEDLDPEDDDFIGKTELYELQHRWAWLTIDTRGAEYLLPIRDLRASDADYEALYELVAEPIFTLQDLNDEVTFARRSVRTASGDQFVVANPRLEDLEAKTGYHLAWAYLYEALAMDDSTPDALADKEFNLHQTIEQVTPYADVDTSGVQDDSRLLIGRARRELGEYDTAIEILTLVVENGDAKSSLRLDAMFEIARALAEQGKFDEALEASEAFSTRGQEIAGSQGLKTVVRMRVPFLNYYIYTLAADAASGREQEMLREKAELALNAYYIDPASPNKVWYLRAIDDMFRDREDTENVPAIALVANVEMFLYERRDLLESGQEVPAEKVEEALELLEDVLSRPGEGASQMGSRAADQKLALIAGESKDPTETVAAAKDSIAEARKGTDADALKKATNAVALMNGVVKRQIAEGGEYSVDPEYRQVYIDALNVLLGVPEWQAKDPSLAGYYFELGWNNSQLAARQDTPEAELPFYEAAIEAYEQTPMKLGARDNTFAHLEGRYLAAELRLYLLLRDDAFMHSDEGDQVATDLRKILTAYGNDVQRVMNTLPEGKRNQVAEWGAMADFHSAALLDDPLDKPDLAGEALSGLAPRWPETSILQISQGLEIRLLIRRGRIDEAIAKLDQFRSSHPEGAEALTELVISQIRSEIAKLRFVPDAGDRLKDLQRNYYRLASQLFEEEKGLPLEDRYRVTQMYADALCDYGEAQEDPALVDEALGMFKECQALKDAEREQAEKDFDAELEVWLKQIDLVNEVVDLDDKEAGLLSLRDTFAEDLERFKYPADAYSLRRVENDVDRMMTSRDEEPEVEGERTPKEIEDVKRDMRIQTQKNVVRSLRDGYKRLAADLKARIPVDPENLYGQARCLSAKGEYASAVGYYNVVRGLIDKDRNPDYFWTIQIARMETGRKAFNDDAAKLETIVSAIDGLDKNSESQFGGYAREFQQMRIEVKSRIKELGG